MIIERTKKEIIFRVSSSTQIDDLQALADYLTFQEIASKSKATRAQANALIKKAKKGRWIKTKSDLEL